MYLKLRRLFTAFVLLSTAFALNAQAQSHTDFAWGETWGGSEYEGELDVTTDAAGNVFIAGSFESTNLDFDPGSGSDIKSTQAWSDVFLSKYNSDGSYAWTKTWGGSSNDYAKAVYADPNGDIYVVGYFATTVDFDPGPGVNSHSAQHFDAFISKFDTNGNHLWVRTWGGTGYDVVNDIVADTVGGVTVTGYFQDSPDFDPGPNVDIRSVHGDSYDVDIFVSRFDALGGYIGVQTYGGSGYEEGNALALDSANNVYVAGYFESNADFDPGSGTDIRSTNGGKDGFVLKLHPSGSKLWLRTFGGEGDDLIEDVALDSSGRLYLSGDFRKTADFDPGVNEFNLSPFDERDAFLSSLSPDGEFRWARNWGGLRDDSGTQGLSVTVTDSETVLVAGSFEETVDFDPGPGIVSAQSAGRQDPYFSLFSSEGQFISSATLEAGVKRDRIFASAQFQDKLYLAGSFSSAEIDLNPGAAQDKRSNNGRADQFLISLSPLYTLSGQVLLSGSALAGVDVDAGPFGVAQSGSAGEFEIPGFSPGDNYTLTPSLYGYYFSPASLSGSFIPGQSAASFNAMIDACPDDPAKVETGVCGCGFADTDSDSDGSANCIDGCPNDANKTAAGSCGCGASDFDADSDGSADCLDGCPSDAQKTAAGVCGCGQSDSDSDSDGTADCIDACPNDANKTSAGICGCGQADLDQDANGIIDCKITEELRLRAANLAARITRLKSLAKDAPKPKRKQQRELKKEAKKLLNEINNFLLNNLAQIALSDSSVNISLLGRNTNKAVRKALKTALKSFKKNKRKAKKEIRKFERALQ